MASGKEIAQVEEESHECDGSPAANSYDHQQRRKQDERNANRQQSGQPGPDVHPAGLEFRAWFGKLISGIWRGGW
jgi:hypothetical protein